MTLSTAISALFPEVAVLFYLAVSLLLIGQPVWGLHVQGRARHAQ